MKKRPVALHRTLTVSFWKYFEISANLPDWSIQSASFHNFISMSASPDEDAVKLMILEWGNKDPEMVLADLRSRKFSRACNSQTECVSLAD